MLRQQPDSDPRGKQRGDPGVRGQLHQDRAHLRPAGRQAQHQG